MFRHILKSAGTLCTAVVVPKAVTSVEQEDGWSRIRKVFTTDEFGGVTPQLSNIYQTTVFSLFTGACYGGFIQSRQAYMTFIERNEASKFISHYEAKKKLQDFVTINFAKGAFKWGWRIGLFAGLYVTTVTALSSYRGKPSIFDYVAGGVLAGGTYRINLGVRGVIIGSTLGAMIGLFAGTLTQSITMLTGINIDEVHQYNSDLLDLRDRQITQSIKKQIDSGISTELISEHDQLLKEKPT